MNFLVPVHLLSKYMGKYKTLRNEARTKRLIAALPRSIQKDIGWPDGQTLQRLSH